jgi:hypothetical protein
MTRLSWPSTFLRLRDEVVERSQRRTGRALAPELVDERVGRNDAAWSEREQGKKSALLRPSEREGTVLARHLERPEDPVPRHSLSLLAPFATS